MFLAIAAFLGIIILAFTGWGLLTDAQKLKFANFLSTIILAGLHGATTLLNDAEPYIEPIVAAFVTAFNRFGPTIAKDVRAPIAAFVRGEFQLVADGLLSKGLSTPDNAAAIAADAMADAFGFGIGSHVVTAAFESAFPEKLNTLNGTGPMIAEMAGFAEVAAAVRDPLYENAFGKSLKYHYQQLFKPDLPSEFDAVRWHAQRFLTDDQLRVIFNFSGLKAEYEEPFVNAAYRTIQPRLLANLYQDQPFNEDQMKRLLERAGILPEQIPIMLDAFKFNSVKNVRNQYLSAVMNASERGTLTPAETDSALTELTFSDDAKHWVRLTIATRKLEQLAELYRKSISEDYKYGLITDAEYVPALEAVGIAQADADAHYAVDSAVKHGRELAAAQRLAAREAAAVTRAATRAALANYQSGNIDAIALAAALAVAGVPVAIIPFSVDVAVLRKDASMRSVAGKLVNADDAVILRERIAALKEQVVKKLLDVQSAFNQLVAFGIPDKNAQDLVATWAAESLKTVVPVV